MIFFSPEKASAEEKEEDTREEQSSEPRPRALHRTMSIFLRNLAPSITKQEVEAVSNPLTLVITWLDFREILLKTILGGVTFC